MNDILLWMTSHEQAKAGRLARTQYDTRYSREDLPGVMDDRNGWRETVKFGLVWFVGFYGILTLVGYLTPNPF